MSKEYGWTDDQILDLTVKRFRQIVAAINRRNFMRRREEITLISWQTRNLASFIAGGYMTDGKGNPALDSATVLAFDEIEAEQIKEAQVNNASSRFGNAQGAPKFDENGDIINEGPEPTQGTFERFMGSMGNPYQWAGR